MVKNILSTLFFLGLALQMPGQQNRLQEAFSQSYKQEETKDYKKAIATLTQVYEEKNYYINLRLGWLCYLAGDQTRAVGYYQKAIQLMPLSIEARLGIAYPLSVLGNWNQIISYYMEILKIDPNHSLTNYRLGSIYYNRGEYDKARRYIEKVVNFYPFDYDSLLLLAWIQLKQGHYSEAKALFQTVLLNRPGDESALSGLGLIK
ncbi:MAG: tetratricopeptide repeat protein [Bacteroidales bacterium]